MKTKTFRAVAAGQEAFNMAGGKGPVPLEPKSND